MIKSKYGNLFQMYEKIVDQNPYETPMMIYPAVHYTMGGVWVDYNLMTTIPGCFAIGEANFSDHGANQIRSLCTYARISRWIFCSSIHYRGLFS